MGEISAAEALQLFGEVCTKEGNCAKCPLQTVAGANITCQEFAKTYPKKFLSILKELANGEISYYDEYITRFPYCSLAVEDLAPMVCRKVVFEGYALCTKESDACKACWLEKYTSDNTVTDEEMQRDINNINKEAEVNVVETTPKRRGRPPKNPTEQDVDAVDIISGILNNQ